MNGLGSIGDGMKTRYSAYVNITPSDNRNEIFKVDLKFQVKYRLIIKFSCKCSKLFGLEFAFTLGRTKYIPQSFVFKDFGGLLLSRQETAFCEI